MRENPFRHDEKVFPVTPNAIRPAWERLWARVGLTEASAFTTCATTQSRASSILGYRSPRSR